MRQIMRSSLDYAGFAQLCGRSPIMREIMRAHNRIIPRSLVERVSVRLYPMASVCAVDSSLLSIPLADLGFFRGGDFGNPSQRSRIWLEEGHKTTPK